MNTHGATPSALADELDRINKRFTSPVENAWMHSAANELRSLERRLADTSLRLAKSCDDGRGDPEYPVCSRAAAAEVYAGRQRAALAALCALKHLKRLAEALPPGSYRDKLLAEYEAGKESAWEAAFAALSIPASQHGESDAPPVAGTHQELEPYGRNRQEAAGESGERERSARRDELRAGGSQRGPRAASDEAGRSEVAEGAGTTPAPLRPALCVFDDGCQHAPICGEKNQCKGYADSLTLGVVVDKPQVDVDLYAHRREEGCK